MAKSYKGTIAVCKAPTPDGTKCEKEFIRKKHRKEDHKFCSNKCRNRNDRSVQKKKRAKEEKLSISNLRKIEKHSQPIKKLKSLFESFEKEALFIIEKIDTPVERLPYKMPHHFRSMEEMNNYNNQRLFHEKLEKERIERLSTRRKHMDLAVGLVSEVLEENSLLVGKLKIRKNEKERLNIHSKVMEYYRKIRLSDHIASKM